MATKLHRIQGEQFFDDDGQPLAGGMLYYDQATTSTDQTTYSNAAGTTPNSNPLVLDAAGRLETSVYFGDSDSFADYKETLTDADDVTITNWPVDNLPAAAPAATAAAFAPPLLSWTQVTNAASPVALAASDAGKAYEADTTSGNIEFDLPSAASVGDGKGFFFKKMVAANSMVIDQSGSETIDNSETALTITRQYQVVAIFSNGAEWYVAWQYLEDVAAGRLPAASDTAAGALEIAIQSEMETATSTTLAVPPGRQHFHPSAAKFWARVNVSGGTPSLAASYNITGITDSGTGLLAVEITTDFSSANWCCLATIEFASTNNTQDVMINTGTLAVGSVQLRCANTGSSGSPSLEDPDSYHVIGFGDHA